MAFLPILRIRAMISRMAKGADVSDNNCSVSMYHDILLWLSKPVLSRRLVAHSVLHNATCMFGDTADH